MRANPIGVETMLRGMTVVALAVTVGAFAWRPALPQGEIAPAGIEGGAAPPTWSEKDAHQLQAIVSSDIFSESRSAPAGRYDPFRTDAGDAPDSGPASGGEEVPFLYGTVAGPGGSAALMRLDPRVAGAQLYRVGERAGNYRIEEIDEDFVVLSGPQGRQVLRFVHPQETVR